MFQGRDLFDRLPASDNEAPGADSDHVELPAETMDPAPIFDNVPSQDEISNDEAEGSEMAAVPSVVRIFLFIYNCKLIFPSIFLNFIYDKKKQLHWCFFVRT
jgi:hypothetical protein